MSDLTERLRDDTERELFALAALWLSVFVTGLMLLVLLSTHPQPPDCMHGSQGDWQAHWAEHCESE